MENEESIGLPDRQDELADEMLKSGDLVSFVNKTLFHGSSEGKFHGDFLEGTNEEEILIWTAEDPRFAQNYIPETGLTLLFHAPPPYKLDEDLAPHDYSNEILTLTGVEFADIEYSRPEIGRHTLKSWRVIKPATHRDVVSSLENLGYKPKDGIFYEIKMVDRQVVPADFKMESDLFIFTGKENLNLADLRTSSEGDLLDPDHRKTHWFEKARKAGYDGVIINDFAQSKQFGNIGHKSIGLFADGYRKLRQHRIDARNFDAFQAGIPKTTPELTEFFNHAMELSQEKRQQELDKARSTKQQSKVKEL